MEALHAACGHATKVHDQYHCPLDCTPVYEELLKAVKIYIVTTQRLICRWVVELV
jgi:hypothetical protein